MSDERQETVAGIVAEMRKYADEMEQHLLYDLRECSTDYLRVLADRIETAHSRFYDKYKEHTDELNRQILVLKREKEMSYTYFCGYDPEEPLVAQCSTCRFFKKKHSHCTLNDSLTNSRYKCSGWKFKTNKECADEYKPKLNAAAIHKALEKFNAVDLSGLEFPLDGDSSTIYNSNKKEITIPYWKVAELLNGVKAAQDMAKAALSEPPRNCDVGTAEEQARRYEDLCDSHTCGSICSGSGCPLYAYDCSPFSWSQMQYEEGGAK